MMMGFIFLWPTFVFSLLPTVLACNSYRNDSILLDPFWAGRFIPFLSGLSQALFCFFFTYGLLCPFVFFFLLGIHGPFANPFGLPRLVC